MFDVRVFQESDLSGTYRVGELGEIDFPLVGTVVVGGRTTGEVAQLLKTKLSAFLQSPQVSVLLKEVHSKQVIIYGQVQRPGIFPYAGPMTLTQLITLAGGFTPMAAREKIRLKRTVSEHETLFEVDMIAVTQGKSANQFLEAGDEVFVPERLF